MVWGPEKDSVWRIQQKNKKEYYENGMMPNWNTEKFIWYNSTPFDNAILKSLSIQGSYFNLGKAVYNKPTINIMQDNEKLKHFLLDSEQVKTLFGQRSYSEEKQ